MVRNYIIVSTFDANCCSVWLFSTLKQLLRGVANGTSTNTSRTKDGIRLALLFVEMGENRAHDLQHTNRHQANCALSNPFYFGTEARERPQ